MYNTEDSHVVTHHTTSSAVTSLTLGEQTGSSAFWCLWLYMLKTGLIMPYLVLRQSRTLLVLMVSVNLRVPTRRIMQTDHVSFE
jgi:hypothetical protein